MGEFESAGLSTMVTLMVSLNPPNVRDGLIWIYYGAWNHPFVKWT